MSLQRYFVSHVSSAFILIIDSHDGSVIFPEDKLLKPEFDILLFNIKKAALNEKNILKAYYFISFDQSSQ